MRKTQSTAGEENGRGAERNAHERKRAWMRMTST